MTKKQALQLFGQRKVRTVWDDEQEKWYFAIVDVVAVLTDSKSPTAYWRKLKQRLKEEGNETVTIVTLSNFELLTERCASRMWLILSTQRSTQRNRPAVYKGK